MVKIVIEISSAMHLRKELRQFDTHEVLIGRGYQNDIIIQDPYASAQHAVLRLTEQGWVVEDQQSRNGIFLLGRKKKRERLEGPHVVQSGEIFFIGNTVLRVFLPEHNVVPAKRMDTRAVFLKTINTPVNALYAIFGFFFVYYLDILLQHPYVDISNGQIIFVELLVFVAVLIWSGFWALIGRMIRHRSRFLLHLTMTCFFLVVMLPLVDMAQYLGFLFSNGMVEGLILMIGGGALFTMLLVSHEAIATFLSLRTRIICSALIPIAFYVIAVIGFIAMETEFQPQPRHYIRLRPPIVKPLFVKESAKFLDGLEGLFDHDK